MEDLRVLFFFYIIESYLLTITGLWLFDYRPNARKLAVIAAIHGLSVWVVRGIYLSYDIPLGTHTLILYLLLFVLIKFIASIDWGAALGATLVSFSLLLIGASVNGVIIAVFKIDLMQVINNPWMHILLGYSEDIFLVIMLIVNRLSGFSIARSMKL